MAQDDIGVEALSDARIPAEHRWAAQTERSSVDVPIGVDRCPLGSSGDPGPVSFISENARCWDSHPMPTNCRRCANRWSALPSSKQRSNARSRLAEQATSLAYMGEPSSSISNNGFPSVSA